MWLIMWLCWSFHSAMKMFTEPPNSAWTEQVILKIHKPEMTSKVKKCDEVLSTSVQLYLWLSSPTLLEADHASPVQESLQESLVILSFQCRTGVKHTFSLPSSFLTLPRPLCGYVVNHTEEPIQAKNNPFSWEQLSLDQFLNPFHPVATQISISGTVEQSMSRVRTTGRQSPELLILALPLKKSFLKM